MIVDGLYLNGVWVAEAEPALNFQANDLTKPDTIQTSYSLSFSLPDTLTIRDLTENAEQLDAGGKYPYAVFKAKLIFDGVDLMPGASARLESFQGGWKVQLFQATRSLFDALGDRSIRTLNLDRYNHPWTVAGISALAGATAGAVYPVIDYGNFDKDTFASDALFPSVYARTIIEQMLTETGYRPAGEWLNDLLLNRIALPFVDDEPQSHDEQWVTDRSARVTVRNSLQMSGSGKTEVLYEFNQDNDPDNYFFDGKQNNFNTSLKAYVCDRAMKLRVQASQTFKLKVTTGAVEVLLIVERNGQNVAQVGDNYSGVYNITFSAQQTISLDETINCKAGDQIRIRFILRRRTLVGRFMVLGYIDPTTCWASFTPDPKLYPGDDWLVARNLPDMACTEVLKSIALLCSATYAVDDVRKTVTLIPLSEVVANTDKAVDWSTRVEESEEPELLVTLEPYGQVNNVKWKALDKVSTYGDGQIRVDAPNLPTTADLFELPFAACLNSEKALTGYGSPVTIPTRTIKNGTLERSATTPRLVLIEPGKTLTAKANVTAEGIPDEVKPVTLTACWWADRPLGANAGNNAYSLTFDRVSFVQREQTLIQRYFKGLTRVLRRPRALTLSMMLTADDVASLDLTRPVRLSFVRAGSLQLSNHVFYLNKISNYVPGYPCRVTLIPY
ncbi:hypothetical protein [Spirosoma sp. KUDC1026]|uniref:hypothetical protein n=1 Tax=Spirosoma sp. KUDC1026 TaxID=2745947 RepID=UPI00159BB9D1|nr:hypothetical protein [Spirosoma sp. KUDC1026]QKZ15206.1 hypothetical protein HU175_22295 [Spirosoma sp. KUDC1026]